MNDKFEIVITTLLGLESFTMRELKRLGYSDARAEDGRVTFTGGNEDIARANMFIRTGERVFIKAGEFTALTYDELFEGTKSLEWEKWICKNGAFPVKGHTLKSQLASERDCQAIIKKAIAGRLSQKYGIEWLPEDEEIYQVQFSLMKDRATLLIDTTGEPLHKRGYRRLSNAAPLRETIAAAIVMMSYWKYEYPLCDPFCGSGTIPIEAALFKENIAPGIDRSFAYEDFSWINGDIKTTVLDEAKSQIRDLPLTIFASDIDADAVRLTELNANNAGVGKYIKPAVKNAVDFYTDTPYGAIICNPPYGERLSDKKSCERLYGELGKMYAKLNNWSCYVIAADEDFERHFNQRADKRRKLYNGMIKCSVYQYFGKKPPAALIRV